MHTEATINLIKCLYVRRVKARGSVPNTVIHTNDNESRVIENTSRIQ